MDIIINHKEAVLKKSTSFELVSENYMFTGADSYSLSITLPIKDCQRNIEIFGHLNRKDCDISETLFDCEIHVGNVHKYGVVSIVELDEVEVKVQFLEGRSKLNFHSTFDDIYINEIEMPSIQITPGSLTPMDLMHSYDDQKDGTYYGYVVLPWVNNTSGNIQNRMKYTESGPIALEWEDENPTVVGFPFLLDIMKRVFNGIGYDFDFSAIENSQWKDCIICNALPEPWDMPLMNYALPHWTVTEFVENLEKLLDGYMHVDDVAKQVSFRFNKDILDGQQMVVLEDVTNALAVEVSEEEDKENSYIETRGMAYQDGGHQMMKFYSCQWAVEQIGVITWNNYTQMYNAVSPYFEHQHTNKNKYSHEYYRKIHYCKDIDTYFVLKFVRIDSRVEQGVTKYYDVLKLIVVDEFSPYQPEGVDDDDVDTIGIVPVCIDDTDDDHGEMVFLECGEFGSADDVDGNDETSIVNKIIAGEKNKSVEYFNMMYAAFWDGVYTRFMGRMPRPIIYEAEYGSLLPNVTGYTMRLRRNEQSIRENVRNKIDQSRKYTFKFLADSIPEVTSKFMIHGKAYLAEKITATFSAETGMSKLMKMEAYRIED